MSATAAPEEGAQPAAEPVFDPRWEFDAPRFYDFTADGSPTGSSGAAGDRWFDTSATKGLASPLDKPKQQAGASKHPPPQQPKQQVVSEAEAKVVRKALAHITNAPAASKPTGSKQQPAQPPPRQKQQQAKSVEAAPALAQPQPAAERRAEAGDPAVPSAVPAAAAAAGPLQPAGEPMELEEQAPKRRRTHSMATRSMTPGKKAKAGPIDQSRRPASRAGAAGPAHGPTLTVPKSPRLLSKQRTRPARFKPREVVEEEEMAAMPKFKARPLRKHILLDNSGRLGVPTLPHKPPTEPVPFSLATDQRAAEHASSSAGAGAGPAAPGVFIFKAEGGKNGGGRPTRSKRKAGGITEQRPFALATDARGEARQAQQAAAAAAAAAQEELLQQQAKRNGKRRRTSGPPQLETDARGEHAQLLLQQKRRKEEEQQRQQAEFKARPLNQAALHHPFKPAPFSGPLTIPDDVVLASDARARERMQFDNAVAFKQQLDEEERAAEEARRKKEEAAELKKFRKGLQFRANPLPDFYGRHADLS